MSDYQEPPSFIALDSTELNEFFPGYEIEGLIATNFKGAVYCALQKSLDRRVALKTLPRENSSDVSFREGFKAEAKAMARLKHPNLIGVYDFGEIDGMLYIMMEYVPGQSIYHSAHGQAIHPTEVVRLISAICAGLAHAHENGIIHKQLRPSNILLDLAAMPKIGDFGVSWPTVEASHEEPYTAPEVFHAPYTADHRADIYSVGVILHELLTGKLPAEDPRQPSEISNCDSRFDEIVAKACHSIAAQRYHNASEMAEDLIAINFHRQRTAPTQAEKNQPIIYEKKSTGPVLALVALLLAAGCGFYFYQKNEGLAFLKPTEPAAPVVSTASEQPVEFLPEPDSIPAPEEPAEAAVPEAAEPVAPSPIVKDSLPPPKIDMDGFYQKARRIMQERARPQISQMQVALKENKNGFETDMARAVRKLGVGSADKQKELEEAIAAMKKSGNRLPENLADTFEEFPGIEEFAPLYLKKQNALDVSFRTKMSAQAATYILGMQKQIERSKAENDATAIQMIETEIQQTRDDPEYFSKLMLGIAPKSASSTEDNVDGGFVLPPDSTNHGVELDGF